MKSLSRPLAITCCEAPFFFRVHDTAVKHVSTQFSRSLTTVHGSILIYMHFGMFARVFTTSMSLQCSISTPAALRHPQKKQPLELWNMYLVHLVDFGGTFSLVCPISALAALCRHQKNTSLEFDVSCGSGCLNAILMPFRR